MFHNIAYICSYFCCSMTIVHVFGFHRIVRSFILYTVLLCFVYCWHAWSPQHHLLYEISGSTVQKRHRWQLRIWHLQILNLRSCWWHALACTMYINDINGFQKLRAYFGGWKAWQEPLSWIIWYWYLTLNQHKGYKSVDVIWCGNTICEVWFCTFFVLVTFFVIWWKSSLRGPEHADLTS